MDLAAGSRKLALGAGAILKFFGVFLFTATLSVATAAAQQVTGPLGSASATTTVDGKQLPAPPPKFGGVIKESAKDSTPWWPPRVVPPKGAPNVLLIGVATPNVKNRTLSACGSLRRALDSVLGLTNLLIASLPARKLP
jgi:hypothetical protein